MPLKFKTKKQRLLKVILEIAAVLGIGLGYYAFIQLVGRGLPCFFYEITGLYCPGCGASRMCMALLRLDLAAAFHYNAVLLFALPVLALMYLINRARYINTGKSESNKAEEIILIIILAVLILFGIFRNIFLPPI